MCSICQDIPIAEYLPNSVINVYKYVYNYLTYLLVNQQINRLNMYKSLSSMFFYILCIHLCSTEELGAVPLSTRSTRWLILVQPQLSSYLFFLSSSFSDCRQNGFCLQAELFLFAIRKNSACSQKNFWLHRTGRVKQYPIGIATRKQGKRIITISYWRHLTNCPSVHRGTSEAEGVPNEVRRKSCKLIYYALRL